MDEYLKLLLEQIRCTKARPYIKQELQDHMEDQIAENMKAGMDHEQAEKEAVRDMGDPVETGISLDSIHRPQAAWKLLGMIILISIAGVLIHAGISGKASENAVAGSDRYVSHVMIGLAVMMILYLLDYTVLAKFSKIIAAVLLSACLLVILEGGQVNGARIFISLPGGRRGMDVQKLMLFYVPIYGAILYKYHGWGYKGLVRAILWLIAPVILVYSLPALRTACVMLVTMLTMLTIAIKKDWFTVRKINALAMEFIYELVRRQLPNKLLIPLKEKEFIIFYEHEERNIDERIKRINSSIEDFLGVRFVITYCNRKESESLKDWFDRAYVQQFNIDYDDNSGKALIQKSISYMEEHYQENLSLKDISRIIGLSGSYFSYLFKQQTGKNYIEYLNEIRLEEAMKDLKNSDEKIVVIAQKHGFQNLEYFSRYFKKKTGESPARWRKTNQ